MSEETRVPVEEVSTQSPAPEDATPAVDSAEAPKEAKTNLIACLGYCPMLFFVPLICGDKKDEVAKNSSVQGLNLLVAFLVVKIMDSVLGVIFGYPASTIVDNVILVAQLALAAVTVIGMVRAYGDKAFKVPVLGNIDLIAKIKG